MEDNTWDKILSGDLRHRIKEGHMIIGPNSADGTLSTWYAESEQRAVELASHFCQGTGSCYEIIEYKFIGVVRPQALPIEFVKPPQETENQ
jgi:hypothetical protein